ncbi:MAG TPA: alpha/beta hydrolase [Candidatus Dormibacteraeota bacterium]|nr:alpha/beta hydrolase [Candidatus Dormibacteraeota bacterium]
MTAPTLTAEQRGTGEYADVNGLHLYYETHGPAGAARTLVLLHGGLESGERWDPVLPALGEGRRVVVPDLQGHGRTADIDRPIDIQLMAEDIAALIDELGLERPDVLGYSLGGGVAFFLAARHPELVGKAIILSAPIRRDAIYADMLVQQGRVNADAVPFMQETPMWELYQRVAPQPENFGLLLDKIGASMATDFDHADVVRSLQVPTLIACGDADMAPPAHYVETFKLLGGGLRDGGWMGEGRPAGGHALAIIPNATHYNVNHSPVFVAAAKAFLDA